MVAIADIDRAVAVRRADFLVGNGRGAVYLYAALAIRLGEMSGVLNVLSILGLTSY